MMTSIVRGIRQPRFPGISCPDAVWERYAARQRAFDRACALDHMEKLRDTIRNMLRQKQDGIGLCGAGDSNYMLEGRYSCDDNLGYCISVTYAGMKFPVLRCPRHISVHPSERSWFTCISENAINDLPFDVKFAIRFIISQLEPA